MSTALGAIFQGINNDKAQVYGLINNAISYAQSKKAQQRAFKYAVALQKQQYDLTQQGYREGPGNQRQGLEDAGYNPMLALGNVGSPVSVSGGTPVGANAVDSPHLSETALNLQHLGNETAQTRSTVALQEAQANTEVSKQTNYEFQNAMLDVEKHLKQKDLDNYDRRFYTEMYEAMQRAENYRAQANVAGYNAESNRILANASEKQADIAYNAFDIAKDKEKRYKEWGEKHPWLRNLDETVNRYINLNFGGSASSGSSVSHVYKH